jgi:hypothetical protein
MKAHPKNDSTIADLVGRFTEIAIEQYKALLYGDTAKFNRLYDQMEAVKRALKNMPGDQRQALRSLYDHSNIQVRLKAAIATLVLEPDAARQVLKAITEANEYPQTANARGMLRSLEEGRFIPQ